MSERELSWASAGWPAALATAGLLVVLVLTVLGRDEMIVFAAPLLGAVAATWWSARPGGRVRVAATVSQRRLFEDDDATLTVDVTVPAATELVRADLEIGAQLAPSLVSCAPAGPRTVRVVWRLRAVRWGRAEARAQLTLHTVWGLRRGAAFCPLPELAVFPRADRLATLPRPVDLPDLLGLHPGRRPGEGVEFAGLREYRPGDPLRQVNWPVSARRGRLHVTERLAEQAAKVVALIDATSDISQPGTTTLQLAVQGTLSVVSAALRRGDRAGVLALGGSLRWLAPDLGQRHYYRVVEAVMGAQAGGIAPKDTTGLPRAALPREAVLVAFTALLDERVVAALIDLRQRGHALVVVDTLRTEPTPRPSADYESLAVLMWRIGRRSLRQRLARVGVPVVHWEHGHQLDEAIAPVSRRPLAARHR